MQEIERKFLVVSNDFKKESHKHTRIIQGFLNTHPERTVRIRTSGEYGYLTIKGISDQSGLTRFEWEKQISLADAKKLLPLCEPGIIDKNRFEVLVGNHTFEIDEFLGENEGLVVTEVELESKNEPFEKPYWLGKEVTGQIIY